MTMVWECVKPLLGHLCGSVKSYIDLKGLKTLSFSFLYYLICNCRSRFLVQLMLKITRTEFVIFAKILCL